VGQTPTYLLPYPELADPDDVPADVKRLADRIEALLPGFQARIERAQPNGYASLDATGKVPAAQLPPITPTSTTRTVQIAPGAATLPDGSAGNLAPALLRAKGVEAAPTKHFLYLAFDPTNDENAYWTFRMPGAYASGGTLKLLWTADTITGAVVWGGRVAAITAGDVDTPLEHVAAAPVVVTTNVNTVEARRLTETTITLGMDGAAAGDLVVVRIFRNASNASDTCAVDAELVAAGLDFTG
jgi:hypothetical protein